MIKDLSNTNAEQILAEIRELKQILSKVIGSTCESPENRFSVEALDKAAKDFHQWAIDRGDWVGEDDIGRYTGEVLRAAPPDHLGINNLKIFVWRSRFANKELYLINEST